MPRLARKDSATSFFHVMSQGIAKENILKGEKTKEKYFEIMNEALEKNNIVLISYCIMDNHVHLLLYTEEINKLSKFMQEINSKYAKYYNFINNGRVGYVFRNRFLSEQITTQRYLNNCINYIHQNPIKAGLIRNSEEYKYCSYNDYKKRIGIFAKLINHNTIKDLLCTDFIVNNKEVEGFLETEIYVEKVLENKIKEFEKEISMNLKDILENKKILLLLIHELKLCHKIRYQDIMKKLNITKWEWNKMMY